MPFIAFKTLVLCIPSKKGNKLKLVQFNEHSKNRFFLLLLF